MNEARSSGHGNMARNAFRERARYSCALDRVGVVCELDSVFVCFLCLFFVFECFWLGLLAERCVWLVFLGFNVFVFVRRV